MKLGKTKTNQNFYGLFHRNGHSALCSDGKIRAIELAMIPDTFFSVPAKIRIKGKTITGYLSTENQRLTSNYQDVYVFRQHTEQKWKHNLPDWSSFTNEQFDEILELAY